jgi:hypothetical protein
MSSQSGYGLSTLDFPPKMSLSTIKKVLDIAGVVAICDFADAYVNRKTTVKGQVKGTLREMLSLNFPNNLSVVETVLEEQCK